MSVDKVDWEQLEARLADLERFAHRAIDTQKSVRDACGVGKVPDSVAAQNLIHPDVAPKVRARDFAKTVYRCHTTPSTMLELIATIRALQAELGELRGRLDATKSTNNSPGRLTGFRQVEHPCEDCIDDWCQRNCGPATPSLEKDND